MTRFWLFLFVGAVMVGIVTGFIAWRGNREGQRREQLDSLERNPSPSAISDATRNRIEAFCGDCHALPRPESFARDQWHYEVGLGYEFYARSGRKDLDPPPMADVVNYYRSLAPEEIEFPQSKNADKPLRATFRTEKLDWNGAAYVLPAISNLRWLNAPWSKQHELFACDMRDGSVSAIDIRAKPAKRRVLANLQNPCHIESSDLDGDGTEDWVVCELGSMFPADHEYGRVVHLRFDAANNSFTPSVLAQGLGRVADAKPLDADRDGDQDLVVAEFGNYRTGGIQLLENQGQLSETLQFKKVQLDRRPGTIHVPIHDFNGDGRLDFAALISQEYERVELFVQRDGGTYERHPVWAAPDLTFNCTGMELVDLDKDGDMDLLVTNGDTFNNSPATPYHGVHWLENLGQLRFAYHRLDVLAGSFRALPVDIDLDGDLDIVAVAFLRAMVVPASLRSPSTASVVCLEQTDRGQFVRHVLEAGMPRHPTLEVGDFDGDGDFDFAVGSFVFPPQSADEREKTLPPRLTIWWNQLRP